VDSANDGFRCDSTPTTVGEFYMQGETMRRAELTGAVRDIVSLIARAQVRSLLRSIMYERPNSQSESGTDWGKQVLTSFSELQMAHARFGPIHHQIISILGISAIFETVFWVPFLGKSPEVRPERSTELFRTLEGIDVTEDYLPKFLTLLDRETDVVKKVSLEAGAGERRDDDASLLTIYFRDPSGGALTASQMAGAVASISSIYEVIRDLYKYQQSDLVVGSLDSGSDKSIDFIGVADAIHKISGLILACWDRVRDGRSLKLAANSRAALEGLEVLEKIDALAAKGTLSAEQAEKSKRGLLRDIDALFQSGVYTSDMAAPQERGLDALPLPRPPLLVHYPAGEEQTIAAVQPKPRPTQRSQRKKQ